MAVLSQRFQDPIAVVALDFNDSVLHGAAGAARRPQLLAQRIQCDGIERQSLDES